MTVIAAIAAILLHALSVWSCFNPVQLSSLGVDGCRLRSLVRSRNLQYGFDGTFGNSSSMVVGHRAPQHNWVQLATSAIVHSLHQSPED